MDNWITDLLVPSLIFSRGYCNSFNTESAAATKAYNNNDYIKTYL